MKDRIDDLRVLKVEIENEIKERVRLINTIDKLLNDLVRHYYPID